MFKGSSVACLVEIGHFCSGEEKFEKHTAYFPITYQILLEKELCIGGVKPQGSEMCEMSSGRY